MKEQIDALLADLWTWAKAHIAISCLSVAVVIVSLIAMAR